MISFWINFFYDSERIGVRYMAVYLITGATGYIGSMLTKRLLKEEKGIEIVLPARNFAKIKELFPDNFKLWEMGERYGPGQLKLLQADLCDNGFADGFCSQVNSIDYIIHCASITKSAEMVSRPVEVTKSIVNTTQNILETAIRFNIKSMVYLSSMEVYGDLDCSDGHNVTESEADNGRIELLRTRSCYPLGKCMAENLCYSYYKECGVPVKIARLAQTFGHGVLPADNRVFAQFARSVMAGRNIVLHTEGRSIGNYCGIEDALEGILIILKKGQDGEAYNVVNEANTMTIRQMAELVATQVAGGKIRVQYDITSDERYGYAADTGVRLSGQKLRNLGWRPEKSLAEMYQDMLEEM